jgi:O-acetylserine/cysteine efflux transporter
MPKPREGLNSQKNGKGRQRQLGNGHGTEQPRGWTSATKAQHIDFPVPWSRLGVERGLPARDLALLVGVAAMWGFNFVPIRWALDEVPPFLLAALRFALAAVPLVFFVRRPPLPWRYLLGYGLAIGAGQFGLLFLAIRLGFPAGLASLLIQVQVFFTIGLAAWITHDPVRPRQVIGACIAAAGVGVIVAERAGSLGTESILGLLLVIAAAASWAAGNTIAKVAGRAAKVDMFAVVVWSSLAAPLPLALASWSTEGGLRAWSDLFSASARAWGSLLFMAYVGTCVGFAIWNRLLHQHSAAAVAPFALLVPIVGLATSALILHEALSWLEGVAACLVLVGLAVTTAPARNRNSVVGSGGPDPGGSTRTSDGDVGPK